MDFQVWNIHEYYVSIYFVLHYDIGIFIKAHVGICRVRSVRHFPAVGVCVFVLAIGEYWVGVPHLDRT